MQVNILTTGESISIREIWMISDEHYGHKNVIRFDNRPFSSVHEMNKALIDNHNSVVTNEDLVIHVGDFTLERKYDQVYSKYISRLNGKRHIFIKGSHDHWMKKSNQRYYQRMEFSIDKKHLVADHYPLVIWPRSHYSSYTIHGHTHLWSPGKGKIYNVSVSLNDYYPISWTRLVEIMDTKEDNINQLKKKE